MANTYVDYTGNGSETDFNFSFPYIKTSHVAVEVNEGQGAGGLNKWVRKTLTTDYTVQTSPNTFVRFTTPPASNVKVRVLRDSEANEGIVDFANGSVLTETELDNSYQHNRYLAQEAEEGITGGALTKNATSGQFNADALRLENLADPDSNDDAVNKGYADGRYVDVAGDTMTGSLTLNADPSSNLHASTKQYVDNNDALQVTKSGDTMSGELNMGSNKVTNLADPTVDADAANKNYVDDTITTSLATGSPPPGVQLATAQIEDDAITYAKLQNVAADNVLLGNDNGAGTDVQELTATEARALLNVADGAEVNVQSNWSEVDTNSDAFIQNKPTIPTNNTELTNGANYITDSDVELNSAVAANTLKVSNATHTGDATGSTALTLATVNSNVGSFTNANITVNAKGLVTAASTGSGGAAGTPNWSSGWVTTDGSTTVQDGATLSFTHNLGSENLVFSIFARDTSGGTNSQRVDSHAVSTNNYGAKVQDIGTNTVTIQLGNAGLSKWTSGGTASTANWNTQQIKVVASASATVAGDEYVSSQGTPTSTSLVANTDTTVGSVTLTLPAGKTWKWVKVVFSTSTQGIQSAFKEGKVKEGATTLSWVKNHNHANNLNSANDDAHHPSFIFEGVPNTTGSNVTFNVTLQGVSGSAQDVTGNRSLYAVGIAS